MREDTLLYYVEEIREVIQKEEETDDVTGYCDLASMLLWVILNEYHRVSCEIISGMFEGDDEDKGHYWNKVGDLIVDVTADQFGIEYGVIDEDTYEDRYRVGKSIEPFGKYAGVWFTRERAEQFMKHIQVKK